MTNLATRVFNESGISISLLARLLNVSRPTLYSWKAQGVIPPNAVYMCLRIDRAITDKSLPLKDSMSAKEKWNILNRILSK